MIQRAMIQGAMIQGAMIHATGTPVRFGLLRLADSAPAVVAVQRGLFRELGLRVELSVEPSWANIADKLAYGLLDAASMLPPLALAAALGLRGLPGRLVVAMGLSAGGNTITLGRAAADAVLDGTAPTDASGCRPTVRHLAARAAHPATFRRGARLLHP